MENNNRNHHNLITLYIAIGSLLTAAIALGVSLKSCSVSQKASEEVKNYFLEVSKPLVTITPIPHQKDNLFLSTSFEKDTFQSNMRFEVKNAGRVAARDIAITEIEIVPRSVSTTKSSLSYDRPPKLSLEPGDLFYFSPEIRFRVDPEVAQKTLDSLNGNGWETYARIAVSYSHGKDLSVSYKTIVEYDVGINKAIPRRSVVSKK
ncbi:hypothetical protein ACFL9T_18155 [Thermodesulfobacteriota bacterium]